MIKLGSGSGRQVVLHASTPTPQENRSPGEEGKCARGRTEGEKVGSSARGAGEVVVECWRVGKK